MAAGLGSPGCRRTPERTRHGRTRHSRPRRPSRRSTSRRPTVDAGPGCACACAPAASAARTCTTTSTAASAPSASSSRWCWATRWPACIEEVGAGGAGLRASATASPSARAGPAAAAASASSACRTIAWTCATTAARCACRMCRARSARSIVIEAGQAHKLADGVSDAEGAMAEPLAVALHAVNRAGPLLGQERAGHRLRADRRDGGHRRAPRRRRRTSSPPTWWRSRCARSPRSAPTRPSTSPSSPTRWPRYAADKGQFDVLFEASGNERALRAAFDVVRPRGIIVQLGLSAAS